jgi:hypothetical protein
VTNLLSFLYQSHNHLEENTMKYEKPKVRGLTDLTTAQGLCISGSAVGDCNPNGGMAGYCRANGWTAGDCVTNGTSVTGGDCMPGTVAIGCMAGQFAQLSG